MEAVGAFEGMKVELVEGELQRVNLPLSEHGRVQGELIFLIRQALPANTLLRVLGETGILLGADTLRGADVTVLRRPVESSRHLDPDDVLLLVEVANETLARDLGSKMIDYAAAGIPHYWVADVNARVVHVMAEPAEDGYRSRQVVRFGEPLKMPDAGQSLTIS